MAKPQVYIDGQAGTTGLRIREWLSDRDDIDVITLPDAERRSVELRKESHRAADLAILCLPDDEARIAAGWAEETSTRIVDASTAHRVADGWVYGMPELHPGQRDSIREAALVSNPGCYPQGVVLSLRPLTEAGLLRADAAVAIHALSGYSGGGRAMMERCEAPGNDYLSVPFESPYAIGRTHKHIPEMTCYSCLQHEPHFAPAVGTFRCGMRIAISLHRQTLADGVGVAAIQDTLDSRYADERFVLVTQRDPHVPFEEGDVALDPRVCNDTNSLELTVVGNPLGHVLLIARLDNLGKGAAGGAIQNMNLMLGLPEERGLPQRDSDGGVV